jgi:hypothetical protein
MLRAGKQYLGLETPLFYISNDGQPFIQVLRGYTYVSLMWYRPTAFGVPYWLPKQFLGWHSLLAWKLAHFTTVLAAAYAIYWLVVYPLRGSRMAGLLSAAIYRPAQYVFGRDGAAGFDSAYPARCAVCRPLYPEHQS